MMCNMEDKVNKVFKVKREMDFSERENEGEKGDKRIVIGDIKVQSKKGKKGDQVRRRNRANVEVKKKIISIKKQISIKKHIH